MTPFLTPTNDWLILPVLLALNALLPLLALRKGGRMGMCHPFLMGIRLTMIGWLFGLAAGVLDGSHIPLMIVTGTLMHMVRELWITRKSDWWDTRKSGWWMSLAGFGVFMTLLLLHAASQEDFVIFAGVVAGMGAVTAAGHLVRKTLLAVLSRWRSRPMPDALRKVLLITLLRWRNGEGLEIPKWLAWRRVTVTQGVMHVVGGVSLRQMGVPALPANIGQVSECLDLAYNNLTSLDGLIGPVLDLDVSGNPIEHMDAEVAGARVVLWDCSNLIRIDNDSHRVIGVDRNQMRDRLAEAEKRTLLQITTEGAARAGRLM